MESETPKEREEKREKEKGEGKQRERLGRPSKVARGPWMAMACGRG